MSESIDLSELPKDPAARLELAIALMSRTNRGQVGRDALRTMYHRAPEPIIDTAAHHLYGDLPVALIDMLAAAELALREPGREIGYGAPYHALDHLYNWLQSRALLPEGMPGLSELVTQLEDLAADGDLDAMQSTIAGLRARVDGMLNAPDFGI